MRGEQPLLKHEAPAWAKPVVATERTPHHPAAARYPTMHFRAATVTERGASPSPTNRPIYIAAFFRSALLRARPRRLTPSASSRIDSRVMTRPSPRAREASASSTAARISARVRSRTSKRQRASLAAPSSLSIAWRTNASWSGVSGTSITFNVRTAVRLSSTASLSAFDRQGRLALPRFGVSMQRIPEKNH